MDYRAERIIAEEFQTFLMNGTLYQGSKPVMWSPVEKTALAEAEIEYHDHKSHTIWVPFRAENGSGDLQGAKVVIWTTTPWTIPSNKAVAYNPEIAYGLYEVTGRPEECWARIGDRYVLADALAEDTLQKARLEPEMYRRLRDVSADELGALTLAHPFRGLEGADGFWDYDVPMIDGDHVTDEAGTGFVHTAPSHGQEDYDAFMARGWGDRMTHNVGEESEFLPHVPLFAGLRVLDHKGQEGKANTAVIDKLVEAGGLLARGRRQ
jgi:Isoleucyl-tRNA synthetase